MVTGDATALPASGIRSLVFIDDVTADRSSRMNCEVFRAIVSAQIQSNAVKLIRQCFIVKTDKAHCKSIAGLSQGKEMSSMIKSVTCLNSVEHMFFLKQQYKNEDKVAQQRPDTASEIRKHLVMSMFSRVVSHCKGFSSKYKKNNYVYLLLNI